MSVRFDATGDRITWAGTGPAASSGFTATWWAYLSVDRDDFSTMLRLHASSGATTTLNVATNAGGQLPCIFTAGGTSTGPQVLPVAGWARVAVTVTGTTSTIYVALDAAGATQSASGTVGANAALAADSGYTVAGRASADASEWFNGRIAHLRIWTTVLTQTEIEAEWRSATPVRTILLFADYPLVVHTDLLDHSGNGRHLLAGSTAVTTEADPPIPPTIAGTLGATLSALAANVAGTPSVPGQVTTSLPALDASLAGTVADGDMDTVLPALEAHAAGEPVVAGDLAVTLPTLAADLEGGVGEVSELTAVLPGLEVGLAGAVGIGQGAFAADLPALTAEMVGAIISAGTAAATLPALTVAASGTVGMPTMSVLMVTLPALTMASKLSDWPPAVDDVASAGLVSVAGPYEDPLIAVS